MDTRRAPSNVVPINPTPHNHEAEQAVLGAMLISRASIETAADRLNPTDFYNPAHQHIYRAITTTWADGRTPDPLVVAEHLNKAGHLDAVGGPTQLAELVTQAGAAAYSGRIEPICDIITDTATRRRLITAANNAIHAAETGQDTTRAVENLVDTITTGPTHNHGGWDPLDHHTIDQLLDRPPGWDAPTLMQVDGGPCLLYPGKVHSFAGESGSAKSWLLLVACHQAITAGQTILYLDFEDSGAGIYQRLIDLGLTRQQAKDGCIYISPEDALNPARWRRTAALIERHQPAITVIDGVTEAMELHGLDLLDNHDTARFLNALPRRIARLGPAVAMIDHVTKSVEGRRGAIGAQHKKAGLDGAAYLVEAVDIFGRAVGRTERRGRSKITVDGKDRAGYVNAAATPAGTVAYLELVSWPDGKVSAELKAPQQADTFEPTHIMEKVSRYVADNPGLSKHAIEVAVKGRSENVRLALELLVSRGHVAADRNHRGYVYRSVTPYVIASEIQGKTSSLRGDEVF